ncbi:uncharacterized protein LOC144162982 [Haemaphysalis longicornis]
MAMMGSAAKTSPAFLLLLVVARAAGQKELSMEACQGNGNVTTFKSVTMSPCNSDPCSIENGESYNITFSAEASSDVETLVMVSLTLKQTTDTTDIESPSSKSCRLANTPCKLTKGETFQGSVQLGPRIYLQPGEASFQLKVSAFMEPLICGHTKLQVVGGTTQAVNTTTALNDSDTTEASTDNSRSDH